MSGINMCPTHTFIIHNFRAYHYDQIDGDRASGGTPIFTQNDVCSFLYHLIQTSSGAHSSSYLMHMGPSFHGGKVVGV
jgi:hypothetical protein